MVFRLISTTFFLMAMWPGTAIAGEDYFLLMFGSQKTPNNPNYSHTFATFVKATWDGDGPCPAHARLEVKTISWLPENGKVRLWALLPECGRNFDLHETLHWCQCSGMRVSLWGPYRICPELFALACRKEEHLASGRVRYKANDTGHSSDKVSNCIHACSSIVEGNRLRVGSPGWGETASFIVLQRIEPYIADSCTTHPWVALALGLEQHPILYREWEWPRSGILGPVYRAFGGERDLQPSYGPPGGVPSGR